MKPPHYQDDSVTVYHGDCLNILTTLDEHSVDAVVTDPPYLLGFMGREWDTRAAHEHLDWHRAWVDQCLRVLKPGGHLLAFGGTRTWHRLAAAIEDAGFEIRDSIAWIYGSGFPKSLNLPGGLGTALKPAHEPVVVARKPLRGTVASNVLEFGTGALNIDGCRVGTTGGGGNGLGSHYDRMGNTEPRVKHSEPATDMGRWPSNVLLDQHTAAQLDKQSGITTSTGGSFSGRRDNGIGYAMRDGHPINRPTDEGGASRFFPTFRYTPKAPTDERPSADGIAHPTVKPLELMRWLVRLVTPPHGIVLDPFAGTGTTGEAAIHEHKRAILIEREQSYLPLIVARLSKPMEVGFDFGEAI